MPLPEPAANLAQWRAKVDSLSARVDGDCAPTMTAFDATECQESGSPR